VSLPLSAGFVFWESLASLAATKIEEWQQGRSVSHFDEDILRKLQSDVLPSLHYHWIILFK
jgi:hypothetical protein